MERQVPMGETPLLIGDGRVARHIRRYLTQLEQGFCSWGRRQGEEALPAKIAACDPIVVLISDDALDPFIQRWGIAYPKKSFVHFSGTHSSERAIGCHPLFSFGGPLCDEATYRSIPFVLDREDPSFESLFPALPNPHFRISPDQKALYHALAVMAGNFSCLLWLKLFRDFEEKLKLPGSMAWPYMQQVFANLARDPKTALTGPLVRGDKGTIARNLDSLKGDPFQQVYESFVHAYPSLHSNEPLT